MGDSAAESIPFPLGSEPAAGRETSRSNSPLAVVTGATRGIGEALSRRLAAARFRLAVVGRDTDRLRTTVRALDLIAGSGRVFGFRADLTSPRSTVDLASELARRFPAIDVLVNNAGALFSPRQTSVDGVEATWALNVEAPFLLTGLLLEPLARGGSGRVVNIGSAAHRTGRLDWDDLERRRYGAWGAYAQSKLALLLWTREAARRYANLPISFNVAHPGFIRSGFGQTSARGAWRAVLTVAELFARSSAAGATTPYFLATSPSVAGVSGQYFSRCRSVPPSSRARDPEAAARLFDRLLATLSSVAPGLWTFQR